VRQTLGAPSRSEWINTCSTKVRQQDRT
jgi:hypothetical protein